MKTAINLTLLAAVGVALTAASPVSALAAARHAMRPSEQAQRVQAYPARGVYLLENRPAANSAAADTNAAENFQDQFAVDY